MLNVYTIQESFKWDEIVKTFSNYDVYYLSGYSKGFELHGDGEPLLFFYEGDDIRAINVVMKRDISQDPHFSNIIEKNKYYDFSTPYGYGGWLIEGNGNIDELLDFYDNWCKDNSIISEVIRFHPVLSNQDILREKYNVLDLGKTISIDLSSEETIWNNFTSKNRNKIRNAQKNEVIIKHAFDDKTFELFRDIYEITMKKDDAEQYYFFNDDFYRSILNDLKDNGDIFYAEYDGKPISSTIILRCNNKLTYHFSGVLTEYRKLQSTSLMLYEISKWGFQNGYETFHLGGGVGSKDDDLYKFKEAFNRNGQLQYSLGRRIFDKQVYDYLVSVRKDVLREHFFPLYRA